MEVKNLVEMFEPNTLNEPYNLACLPRQHSSL